MADTPISQMTPFTPLARMLLPVADPALGNGLKNGSVSILALASYFGGISSIGVANAIVTTDALGNISGQQVIPTGGTVPITLAALAASVATDNNAGALIAAETTRAEAAEATLTSNLASEATTRATADATNANAITAETTRAEAAEATLTGNLASEVTARSAAISSEATTRATADATNANAITAETTRAEAAEATLQPKAANTDTVIAANALVWSSSLVLPWATESTVYATATSNATLAFPTGAPAGTKITLIITQDATGSRLLAFAAGFVNPLGIVPVLSTAPGAVDVLDFYMLPSGKCMVLPIYGVA
ncbi:MAG: hypothetical protein B7W99_01880 [Rhodospirillales bacterium 20-58-10]|nr:MAG: hypothetical protein B7W99_01880 [Rhodospirillales bacterium 20-58-10]